MRTEDLIAVLSSDPPRPRWSLKTRLAGACGVAAGAVLLIFALSHGLRPDLASALGQAPMLFKLLFTSACAVCALVLCRDASRPEASPRVAAVLAAPAAILALGVIAELALTRPGDWAAAAVGRGPLACFTSILALSALPVAAALVQLRAAAPRSPALAGAGAALLGGGLGAAIFALYCPNDSALFVAVWYGPALLALGAVGALAGRRLLAW